MRADIRAHYRPLIYDNYLAAHRFAGAFFHESQLNFFFYVVAYTWRFVSTKIHASPNCPEHDFKLRSDTRANTFITAIILCGVHKLQQKSNQTECGLVLESDTDYVFILAHFALNCRVKLLSDEEFFSNAEKCFPHTFGTYQITERQSLQGKTSERVFSMRSLWKPRLPNDFPSTRACFEPGIASSVECFLALHCQQFLGRVLSHSILVVKAKISRGRAMNRTGNERDSSLPLLISFYFIFGPISEITKVFDFIWLHRVLPLPSLSHPLPSILTRLSS